MMDPLLRTILVGDQQMPGSIGGQDTDNAPDFVSGLINEQLYGIQPPSAVPVKKMPPISELEKSLYEMRKSRRTTFAERNAELLAGARKSIRAAVVADAVEDYPEHAARFRLMQ